MPNRIELLAKNKSFHIAAGIALFIILVGILGPMFTRNPEAFSGDRYESPNMEFKLGTDHLGRDIWARMIHGIRNSLLIGFTAGGIGIIIAIIMGGVGAYIGGLTDEGVNLVTNVFLVIPMIPLLILLSVLFAGGSRTIWTLSMIIAIVSWPGASRAIRSQVLSLKERNFIELATVSGKGDSTILVKEIFPNMLAYIFIQFCNAFGGAVMAEAGIGLIGLGPSDTPTIGTILHFAISNTAHLQGIWWWFIPPGVVLIIFTTFLLVFGSILDDVLNPKLRGRVGQIK